MACREKLVFFAYGDSRDGGKVGEVVGEVVDGCVVRVGAGAGVGEMNRIRCVGLSRLVGVL